MHGAGDEPRTRNLKLGRLLLYQLSYTREVLLMRRGHGRAPGPVRRTAVDDEEGGGEPGTRTPYARRRQIYSLLQSPVLLAPREGSGYGFRMPPYVLWPIGVGCGRRI